MSTFPVPGGEIWMIFWRDQYGRYVAQNSGILRIPATQISGQKRLKPMYVVFLVAIYLPNVYISVPNVRYQRNVCVRHRVSDTYGI